MILDGGTLSRPVVLEFINVFCTIVTAPLYLT